jgi:hypothetical protein
MRAQSWLRTPLSRLTGIPARRIAFSALCLVTAALLPGSHVALAQSSAPGTDPLSLQSIQESVRTFKQRGETNREPAAGRNGRDAVQSEGAAKGTAKPGTVARKVPPGTRSHQGGEAKAVTATEAQRRPLTAEKARPTAPPGTPASAAQDTHAATGAAGQIAFAGSATTPAAGVDPRIRQSLEAAGERGDIYAFLLMNEMPGEETERALRQLGVTPLGLHGSALKVRVPLRAKVLDGIAALPGLHSLAYALPDQKISPDLKGAVARFSADVAQFPVIVNLFEADAKGAFAERLRATKAELGRYDDGLHAYEMLATPEQIKALSNLDFVLFIEIERRSSAGHDQSMATNGVDYIRSSGFLGAGVVLGLLDTGAMLGSAAATMHQDLNKNGCGANFTSDAAGVWNDQNGHGSHVLGTISGTGTAQARFRGVAPALGAGERIRVGKIWNSAGSGQGAWMRDAIDFMAEATSCGAPRPALVNISGGASGTGQTGTDAESRKLDARVWETRQAYVVCSGNNGPGAQTIWSPGVAKNALTVGNVRDAGDLAVGELANNSSRGPSGDGRMKPDIVATGNVITSVQAGTTNGYTNMSGCSMATPHVSGIVSSLLEHYPDFRNRPHLLRAHLMASAILHSDEVTPANNTGGGRNDYGLGRVSDYESHWARPDPNGWSGHWAWMTVTDRTWGFFDLDVPAGTRRLVVVLTWDEPAASAGAARAVTYDVDLWADFGASCVPDPVGQCGQWASQSDIDNVEYLVINSPPPGRYRLKAVNWRAPASGLPVAIAAKIVRGDPTPPMTMTAALNTTAPPPGVTFTVTTRVNNPAYEAYGVQVSVPTVPAGLTLLGVSTTREDGVTMDFPNASVLTLGTVTEADNRTAVWRFRASTKGPKTVGFRAWSNNGGTVIQNVTFTP